MPPKKAANGYKLPKPLTKGEVLTDTMKKRWIVGPVIGRGGFGEIYCAADADNVPSKVLAYGFVIKLEPHENGPLFVERNFYMRVAKKEDISEWVKSRKYSSFGLSSLYGSGSHDIKGIKHRFVVMERYGQDLWTIFLEQKRLFPLAVVLRIAIQVLDVLEYIHSKDYVHADIKGANLLLGFKKGSEGQVYVVDFGLASRFTTSSEYKRDPKKAHNGTIEYTSRDAHMGVPTRRGDLEILAYNIVHWLTSRLPWESIVNSPAEVEEAKIKAMKNVPEFLKKCFGKKAVPEPVSKFVSYVAAMKFDEAPDYAKVRGILTAGLKACGGKSNGPFDFHVAVAEEEENAAPQTTPQNGEGRNGTPRGRGRPRKEEADKAVKGGRKPGPGRPRKRVSSESSPAATPDSDDIPEPKKKKSLTGCFQEAPVDQFDVLLAEKDAKGQRGRRAATKAVNYEEESMDDSSPHFSEATAKRTYKKKPNSRQGSPVLKPRHPNFFMQAGVYQRKTD